MAEGVVLAEGEFDPERCPGATAHGPCRHKRVPGKEYCPVHSGAQNVLEKKENIRMYRMAKYRDRMETMLEHPEVKSLREEIGLTRVILQEVFDFAERQTNGLYINATKITDLVRTLEKLVKSCHQLEKSSGHLLDKTAAMQLMGRIIAIIGENVEDPEVVGKISEALITELKNTSGSTTE